MTQIFLWRPILFLSQNGFYRNNIYLQKLLSKKNVLNLNSGNAAWQKYSCENPYIFSVTFHLILSEIASILQKSFSEEDAQGLNSTSTAWQKYVCEIFVPTALCRGKLVVMAEIFFQQTKNPKNWHIWPEFCSNCYSNHGFISLQKLFLLWKFSAKKILSMVESISIEQLSWQKFHRYRS